MSNLRALVESDLETTLEGEWAFDVKLIPPDGVAFPARGQVLFSMVRHDAMSGERVVYDMLVVTLRRSSLRVVPVAGETWLIECPVAPTVGAPIGQYILSPVRPPEGGAGLGFIRLYLQLVEQPE